MCEGLSCIIMSHNCITPLQEGLIIHTWLYQTYVGRTHWNCESRFCHIYKYGTDHACESRLLYLWVKSRSCLPVKILLHVCERLIIPLSQDPVIPVSKGFHHTLWVMSEPHLHVKHSSSSRVKISSHRQLRFDHIKRVHTNADTSVQVWGGNGSPNTGRTSGFLSWRTPTSNNSDVKWKDSQNCPLPFPTFLFSQTHLHASWPPTNPLSTHKHTCTASFTVTRGGNHSAAFWPHPHPRPSADSSCLPRCASSWVRGRRSPQSWGRWCRRNPRWPSTDRSPPPDPPGEKQQQQHINGRPTLICFATLKKSIKKIPFLFILL